MGAAYVYLARARCNFHSGIRQSVPRSFTELISLELTTMRRLLLTTPATLGGLAMAWSLHASGFANFPKPTSFLWAAVLLCPFLFVAVVAWRSRAGTFPSFLAVLPALLLAAAPLACISDRFSEGCQYLLVLSPIYLWTVVAIAAILELWTRRPLFRKAHEAEF